MRDSWTETTLGELVDVQKGKKPPVLVDDTTAGEAYQTADVLRGSAPSQFVPPSALAACVPLRGDETILLWDGAGAGDVFRAAAGVLASTMAKLTIKPLSALSAEYLYLVVLNAAPEIKSSCRGTTVPHVSPGAIAAIPLRHPPLPEQRRIVDVVASIDDYLTVLQQQAERTRIARTAVLHNLLTSVGNDWLETTLGKTLSISRGGSPRPIKEFITAHEDGINWVKIGDATNSSKYIYKTEEKIKPSGAEKSRQVIPGDFILSNSMSFGRPYIMRCDGCIHDGWLLLSNVSTYFDEDFLYNLLMSDYVQKQFNSLAAGSGVRNLNIDVVKEVAVALPPLNSQREIASVANSMDEALWAIEQAVSDAKVMRQAVLVSLLSGDHEIPETYDHLLGAV
jgi:restriction endonuclease S subunit